MINPKEITNFNRTKAELEEFLLFCIIVAGKTASIQAKKLDLFLINDKNLSPFELVKSYIEQDILLEKIQTIKLGQYKRLIKAFAQVLKLDVFNCTIADLESITGIGPKTARFFILHSRPNQKVAVLDTYILKWLREEQGIHNTPKSTPDSKTYLVLEQFFLIYCETYNVSPATLDLEIWNKYSSKRKNKTEDEKNK